MSAQNRYATLESDLKGKGAEAPPALPSRRRTLERLTGRTAALSGAPDVTARAPVAPTAGDVFYDKGAATADNFRPSYWTYEHGAAHAAEQPAKATPPAAAEAARVVDLVPPQPPRAKPAMEPANATGSDEPPAVVGMPPEPRAAIASHQPAVADELAATIEHVLGSRYAGDARPVPDSAPKPRLMAAAITADSLMAELAEARQSRSGQSKPAVEHGSSRPPKKATSLVDRAFAYGAVALILFTLLALSPWRDSLLSPSISHFFG